MRSFSAELVPNVNILEEGENIDAPVPTLRAPANVATPADTWSPSVASKVALTVEPLTVPVPVIFPASKLTNLCVDVLLKNMLNKILTN